MKIAIQLFGHLRTYKKCFPALKKNLLDKYDCDIFMHTWDTVDHSTQTWHKNRLKNPTIKTEETEIVSLYHPKRLKIEKQIPVDLGTITAKDRQISIFGIQSMFYSMKSVNDLRENYEKENNIQYDFVIFIRPDILLLEDFNIEGFTKKYVSCPLENFVFHGGSLTADNFDFQWIGGVDTVFFMKPKASDVLFSDLDNFIQYLKKDETISYGSEYFLIKAEEKLTLKPVLLKYFWGVHFEVLRPFSWKNLRREIISIKTKKKTLKISLFSIFQKISLHLTLTFLDFGVDFLIGKEKNQ